MINNFSRILGNSLLKSSNLLPLNRRLFPVDKSPFPESSSVLSLIREKKLSYRFVFSPEVKTNRTAFSLLKTIYASNEIPDFLLVHFPQLDVLTHREGINSIRKRELVTEIDSIIAKTTDLLSKDSHVITFSDHGMVAVTGYIDIIGKIRHLNLTKSDYVVFLDSVMARFWVFKPSAFRKIKVALSQEVNGTIIENQNEDMVNKFGNIMFVCSIGYIIFPNYYDPINPPKTMHGYIPSSFGSPLTGIFLADGLSKKFMKVKSSMTDLMPVLKHFIENR